MKRVGTWLVLMAAGGIGLGLAERGNPRDPRAVRGWNQDPLNQTIDVPALLRDLQSPSKEIREDAGRMVAHHPDVVKVLPELFPLLTDDRLGVRMISVWIMGHVGTASEPIIPILVRSAKDPDEGMRQVALEALDRVKDPRGFPALIEGSWEDGEWTRGIALRGLNQVRASAAFPDVRDERAVETLIAALDHPDLMRRRWAVEGLGRLGAKALTARHALQQAGTDEDPWVREGAAWVLQRIAQGAAPYERIERVRLIEERPIRR